MTTVQNSAGNTVDVDPVYSPGGFFTVSASFTRPADTSSYTAGDRVANATSGAAVLEFTDVARAPGEAIRIERLRMRKTSTTLANAQFRVHLFRTLPTVSANDNAQFNNAGALALADIAGYVGTIDVTMDKSAVIGARGVGVPATGSGITCEAATTTSLWAVVEALAAYAPGNAEVFTITLEAARS